MGFVTTRIAFYGLLLVLPLAGQEVPDVSRLEQLLKQEVFSVGKKPQRLDRSAAAVSVITQDDIRRSGVSSIPEALRLAPGVMVSRINGDMWAVSIRGFNNQLSNKLLVLIDGRTVYSPLFAGVFWETEDVMLEDIDRIEVIRGPAAALWGANAVNGVVNVITKRAEATQGGLVSVTAGNEDRLVTRYRYGGQIRTGTNYRLYGSETWQPQAGYAALALPEQSWGVIRGGFRIDHDVSERTSATLQGDIYETFGGSLGSSGPGRFFSVPLGASGGNVLGRWSHVDRWGGETTVQSYFDWGHRQASFAPSSVNTFDVDARYRRKFLPRQEFQFEANLRHVADQTQPAPGVRLVPLDDSYNTWGLSASDEITLVSDRLWITAGVRADRSWLGEWAGQPTGRILWSPTARQSVWASASRAVRVQTRLDAGLELMNDPIRVGPFQAPVYFLGNPDMQPESSVSYELGYRNRFSKHLSLDVTAFRSSYQHLLDFPLPGTPGYTDLLQFLTPRGLVFQERNMWTGVSHGIETAVTSDITSKWRVTGSLSTLLLRLRRDGVPWGTDTTTPHYLWQIRSQMDPARHLQADVAVYAATGIEETAFTPMRALASMSVPARTRVDARLGWSLSESCEASVGVRDVLVPHRMEYVSPSGTISTGVRRNFYVKLVWRL